MEGRKADSYKVRIVRLGVAQIQIAKDISDDSLTVFPSELSYVVNGRAYSSERNGEIRRRLERYLTEKEKEQGWI